MVNSEGPEAVDGWWDANENTDDVLSLDRALEGGLGGDRRRVLRPNSRSRPGRPRLWREGGSSMADWGSTDVRSRCSGGVEETMQLPSPPSSVKRPAEPTLLAISVTIR